jgi:hypothetical protein
MISLTTPPIASGTFEKKNTKLQPKLLFAGSSPSELVLETEIEISPVPVHPWQLLSPCVDDRECQSGHDNSGANEVHRFELATEPFP